MKVGILVPLPNDPVVTVVLAKLIVRPTPVPTIEIPTPLVRVVMKFPVEPVPTNPVLSIPSNKSALRLVTLVVDWELVKLTVEAVRVVPTEAAPVTVKEEMVAPADKFWIAVQVLALPRLRPKV